ncbi:hypothetical protein JTE90_018766 [Oedothorax gibbosus]|uniref:Uncharacterized protein n=1 Tax=Oedothorax gibbosus TaxID=931172 RepID=A0AAV6UW99_9ARAC|nr:hypothetical protein JTE90_018766 [Oedothorax gibbosus]
MGLIQLPLGRPTIKVNKIDEEMKKGPRRELDSIARRFPNRRTRKEEALFSSPLSPSPSVFIFLHNNARKIVEDSSKRKRTTKKKFRSRRKTRAQKPRPLAPVGHLADLRDLSSDPRKKKSSVAGLSKIIIFLGLGRSRFSENL